MTVSLAEKSVLISPGASGLGYACAQGYVRACANVAVAAISGDAVDQAVAELQGISGNVIGVVCDVKLAQQVEALVSAVSISGKALIMSWQNMEWWA